MEMKIFSFRKFSFLVLSAFYFIACKNKDVVKSDGWEMFNGNYTANKYSSLAEIDTNNVQQLQVAWTYNTGDADTAAHSQIQCNPIIVNGVLYATSPQLKLLALDAATGKELWTFAPYDTILENKLGHFNLNN